MMTGMQMLYKQKKKLKTYYNMQGCLDMNQGWTDIKRFWNKPIKAFKEVTGPVIIMKSEKSLNPNNDSFFKTKNPV